MGRFAETTNINCHLSFSNQENKIPFSVFRLQKTNRSLSTVVFSKDAKKCLYIQYESFGARNRFFKETV